MKIDAPANRLTVGRKEELAVREVDLRDVSFIEGRPSSPVSCQARLRYQAAALPCACAHGRLSLKQPCHGASQAEAAVLYSDRKAPGGGFLGSPRSEKPSA